MRKWLFIFLCFFLTGLSAVSILVLPYREQSTAKEIKFIEIWHIDVFEGGTGSRKAYLERVAAKYRQATGVTVAVKGLTGYAAYENFKNGIFPDLISYGNGFELPYSQLIEIEGGGGEPGRYGEKQYAIAWARGGYVLIRRKGVECTNYILSTQKFTQPLLACNLSGLQIKNYKQVKSTQAIYDFYSDKHSALIGTQRDLYRLENKGIETEVVPLGGYNDIYQYFSILSAKNYLVATSFIKFVTDNDECRKMLVGVGLLPCDKRITLSDAEPIGVLADVEYEYVLEPFMREEQFVKMQKDSVDYQLNSESIKNSLKRLK